MGQQKLVAQNITTSIYNNGHTILPILLDSQLLYGLTKQGLTIGPALVICSLSTVSKLWSPLDSVVKNTMLLFTKSHPWRTSPPKSSLQIQTKTYSKYSVTAANVS